MDSYVTLTSLVMNFDGDLRGLFLVALMRQLIMRVVLFVFRMRD